MNEVEPVSPSPSTPSSGSPPPEDILNDPPLSPPVVVPNSSQAKRRLPTGTPSGHSRDLKTRKRDDGNSRRTGGGGWTDGREGGKQREELVDIELAERLRRVSVKFLETETPIFITGGEERIDIKSGVWNDSFIVNLGTDALEGDDKFVHPTDLDNWHVDGDFFVHYLDSPEQALLVIPVFSEIIPRGGGTFISPDGIGMIANYLAKHPEGVNPTGLSFTPSTSTYANNKEDPGYWSHLDEIKNCKEFVEITGEIGDVVLMHPLMLHSASKNHLRIPRVITNPPVSLNEPFNFNRENPDEFSLVELKTLKELGVDRLDFKITTERKLIIPKRLIESNRRLEEEKKRLAAIKAANAQLEVGPQPVAVA